MPNGTDKWEQYAAPATAADKWDKYTTGAASADVGKPAFSPGTYQLRPGGPQLDPSKSPLRTGVESLEGTFGIHDPKSVGDAAKQAGGAAWGETQKSFQDWKKALGGNEPMEKYLPFASAGAALMTPFDLAAKGIEGVAGGLESSIKDVAAGWDKKDWRSIAAGAGEFVGTKMQVDAPEHVQRAYKTAAALIERQPTVEQGKIGYVNSARKATQILDNAVRTQGVGVRAQSVIDADKLELARTGSEGKVDTTDAVLAAQKVFEKTKMGTVPGGYPGQMSMDTAKATMTHLGREASKLDRTGKAPEAAAVWAEYSGLREATQKRAVELGMGKEWSDYAKEYSSYMKLQGGLLGHIMEGEHSSTFNKILEHSGQLPELQKWFDKYNVDMSPIRDAAVEGKKLHDLTQQSSNALMGKIKLLSKHWMLALPTLAAAHVGSSMMGLSGGIGGMILPLILAGKVGGLLDTMQVKSLLYDLQKKIPPEQFQVAPDAVGPLEKLHTAAAAPPVPAENLSAPGEGGGESEMERLRRAPPAATAEMTPEEKAHADVNKKEAAPTADTPGERAEKIKAARTVYKGRRGGQPTSAVDEPVTAALRAIRTIEPHGAADAERAVQKVMDDAKVSRAEAVKAIKQAIGEADKYGGGAVKGTAGRPAAVAQHRQDIKKGWTNF